MLVLGIVMLLGGLLLLLDIYRSRVNSTVSAPVLAAAAPVHHAAATISGNPVNLQIPSLGTDLPIIPGVYDAHTQKWTLTTDKVQYATMTPEPNTESGNTFLYGHYRKNVFANLHTIKPGAEAIVKTDNGHTFYYRLNGVKVVTPEESAAVLGYQGKPIMTIQTCTGIFFQNRQLFYFDLVKAV